MRRVNWARGLWRLWACAAVAWSAFCVVATIAIASDPTDKHAVWGPAVGLLVGNAVLYGVTWSLIWVARGFAPSPEEPQTP